MSEDVLSTWLQRATEATGAHSVELRRARNKGEARQTWTVGDVTARDVTEAAVEDITKRRMARGRFEIVVVDVDRVALRKRVEDFDRDDAPDGDGDAIDDDNPWKSMYAAAAKTIDSLTRAVVDLSKGSSTELRLALGEVTQSVVAGEGRVAEAMTTMFEMSTLKEERAKDERASAERREMVKTGMTELAPVLGAALTSWRGTSDPAVRSLLGTITKEQQDKLFEIFTLEQQVALAAAIAAFDKGKAAPSPAKKAKE